MAPRKDRDIHKNVPATKTGSTEQADADLQDIADTTAGVSQPDMSRDPLAGSLDQASMQTDSIEDATAPQDTGLPAKDDAAPSGGPGSKNTSAPAGAQIGADSPPGAVAGDGTATCPPDFPVKGHQESLRFHIPGRSSYDDVIPSWCFASEADALNAGYSASDE